MKKVKYLILILLILSCREQAIMPKPDGYFRIEFNKRIEDGLKLGEGELDTVGFDSVFTLVPDDQKDNYTNLFMGDDSEFLQIFGQQIAESDASAVNLGTHDLSIIFPNMGLTGTYELIWDNNSKNLLFK